MMHVCPLPACQIVPGPQKAPVAHPDCSQAKRQYAISGKQIAGLLVYAIMVETPAS